MKSANYAISDSTREGDSRATTVTCSACMEVSPAGAQTRTSFTSRATLQDERLS